MNSPPQMAPSSPYPVPSKATPMTGRSPERRCSAMQAAMWPDKGVLSPGEAECILQLPPDSKNRECFARQLDREGRVAARAAQRIGLSVECPNDRVITPGPNLSVVHEEGIRQACQGTTGLVVLGRNRLFAQV